jgi:hypothetical protein
MPYISDWEQLAGAVKRIMASSVEEDQAKRDLCNAIADGKISVRATIYQHNKPDRYYFRENVGVPKHLQPINIDWINSRPTAKWWIGPALGQHYTWEGIEERIDLVEVARADVTELLCSNETRFAYPASGEKPRTVGLETNETPPSAPTTRRPTLAKLLADALKRRYPDGRPAVKEQGNPCGDCQGPRRSERTHEDAQPGAQHTRVAFALTVTAPNCASSRLAHIGATRKSESVILSSRLSV